MTSKELLDLFCTTPIDTLINHNEKNMSQHQLNNMSKKVTTSALTTLLDFYKLHGDLGFYSLKKTSGFVTPTSSGEIVTILGDNTQGLKHTRLVIQDQRIGEKQSFLLRSDTGTLNTVHIIRVTSDLTVYIVDKGKVYFLDLNFPNIAVGYIKGDDLPIALKESLLLTTDNTDEEH